MKSIKSFASIAFVILFIALSKSQSAGSGDGNKGKIKLYWGWNTSFFTRSDVRFKGPGYDFTLKEVKAYDDPEINHPLNWDFTQSNYRIGYFINDHYELSLGVDHMKYIMDSPQTVSISGCVDRGSNFDGKYDGSKREVGSRGKLVEYYKHTNGLNYANFELTRYDDMTRYVRINPKYVQVSALVGVGAGVLYPKSFVKLMDYPRSGEWSFAGFGASIKTGLTITLFKYFFIQPELKGGYINMPWARTTKNSADKASQDFFFVEQNILFGAIFKLF